MEGNRDSGLGLPLRGPVCLHMYVRGKREESESVGIILMFKQKKMKCKLHHFKTTSSHFKNCV